MAVILPDAPGVVKLIFKGTNQNQPWVNTFHIRGGVGNYSSSEMEALATAMHSAYFNAFIPQLNAQTVLLTTQAIDLTSRQSYVGVEDIPHAGTATATQFPALQVAYCISWLIVDRYRGGHPRMYLPAASVADFTGGRTLTGAKQGQLQNAASGFLTAVSDLTVGGQVWEGVAVRYWSHQILQDPPLQRPIISSAVHTRIDTMRRRLGREAQ